MEKIQKIKDFQRDLSTHCLASTVVAFVSTYFMLCLNSGFLLTLLATLPILFIFWKFSVKHFNINKARADSIDIKYRSDLDNLVVKEISWTIYEAATITLIQNIFGIILAFGIFHFFQFGIFNKDYNPLIAFVML